MSGSRQEERFGPLPAIELRWLSKGVGIATLQQRCESEHDGQWVDVPMVSEAVLEAERQASAG